MGTNNKSQAISQRAGFGLRLAALALTLLGVVVVFAFRFADNANEPAAIMWAGAPVLLGLISSFLLSRIKKLSSQKRRWEIYTVVLLLVAIGILINTWFM